MSAGTILGAFVVVVLVGVAAVLSAAETSITHIRRARASVLRDGERENGDSEVGESQRDRVGQLTEILDERGRYLAPVALVILSCHIGAAALTAILAYDHFGKNWVLVALLFLLVFSFVVGEALPKTWALVSTDGVALAMTPLVRLLSRIVPVGWAATSLATVAKRMVPRLMRSGHPAISEEELLAVADRALESEAIDQEEHELVGSVIAFGDTLVREVMVPRLDMVTIRSGATVTEAIELTVRSGRSRVPLEGSGTDDLVGIVHVKDLMRAQLDGRGRDSVTSFARPTHDVPETKRADELLRDMQADHFHLAVVIDEYGGTAGIVTMEDLLEEVFGDIVDEFDSEEPLAQSLAGGAIRVHGRMPVDELDELLGDVLPDGDWDTVGGLLFDALGHVPVVGEGIELAGRRFDVEQVVGRRITQVRIGAPQI